MLPGAAAHCFPPFLALSRPSCDDSLLLDGGVRAYSFEIFIFLDCYKLVFGEHIDTMYCTESNFSVSLPT